LKGSGFFKKIIFSFKKYIVLIKIINLDLPNNPMIYDSFKPVSKPNKRTIYKATKAPQLLKFNLV
jgi:hypothetical protein